MTKIDLFHHIWCHPMLSISTQDPYNFYHSFKLPLPLDIHNKRYEIRITQYAHQLLVFWCTTYGFSYLCYKIKGNPGERSSFRKLFSVGNNRKTSCQLSADESGLKTHKTWQMARFIIQHGKTSSLLSSCKYVICICKVFTQHCQMDQFLSPTYVCGSFSFYLSLPNRSIYYKHTNIYAVLVYYALHKYLRMNTSNRIKIHWTHKSRFLSRPV